MKVSRVERGGASVILNQPFLQLCDCMHISWDAVVVVGRVGGCFTEMHSAAAKVWNITSALYSPISMNNGFFLMQCEKMSCGGLETFCSLATVN